MLVVPPLVEQGGDLYSYLKEKSQKHDVMEVLGLLSEIDDVVAGFFRGRLLVCLMAAVITSVGLLIAKIDFWLLKGTAAGFLGIIPFFGVALTLIPALGIALASPHNVYSTLGVLLTFLLVQGFVEPFVGPFVISGKVRLHPVTVTIAYLWREGRCSGLWGCFWPSRPAEF